MDRLSNLDSLWLNVDDDIALWTIETDLILGVTDLASDIASNLLVVDLFLGAASLSKQDNLFY